MIKTLNFRPSRIGCPSIPGTVRGIIVSLPGVKDAKIHYEERSVEVSFDDSQITEDDISKKIGEEMGLAFTAHGEEKPAATESPAETCPM
jgi:copper chaperone CopZ